MPIRYPWEQLTRKGAKVLIKRPKRSARIAASAYAGRHGFVIAMSRTESGLVVERVTR